VARGASSGHRVGALALGEQPLGEPRSARQRSLDPIYLDDVDPDSGRPGVRPGHGQSSNSA
jgi:hypothetical protein